MELKIGKYELPSVIEFNYEELKKELVGKADFYASLVYTDEQIASAKSDRASLNKLKTALNNERLRREREYLEPFNEFKAKINDIIGIIDKPVLVIDKQIKEFENKKKQDKLSEIKTYFDSLDRPKELDFDKIFEERWLNASTNINSVFKEIEAVIDTFNKSMDALSKLPFYAFEAQQMYILSLDAEKALKEANRLSDLATKKAEYERVQKERAEQAQVAQVQQAEVKAEVKQWVSFKANLSTEQAKALKNFFRTNNIECKAL